MKDIAVFGGTFDPPTLAHEGIVEACLKRPDIDEVWLMPSGCRTDKPGMSANAARIALLETVRIERFGGEAVRVTDFEQRLPQPTQTNRTARELRQAHPEDRLWFVYGADAYRDMPHWENGDWLRRHLGLLLVERAGCELPPESERIRHLDVASSLIEAGISSSSFHEAWKNGKPVEHFVSASVLRHIQGNDLYGVNPALAGRI